MSGILSIKERGSITKHSQDLQTAMESDNDVLSLRLVMANRIDCMAVAERIARCNHDVPTHQRVAIFRSIRI
jgi:hypothetical protein